MDSSKSDTVDLELNTYTKQKILYIQNGRVYSKKYVHNK